MHRFGGYQANCTFLIDRLDLLQQFGAIAAGETHQREIQRRQRLIASLMPRKTIRVATDVQRQLFLLLDDNYFSRPTTITFCHLGRIEASARGRLPFRDGSGRWECGQPAFGFPLFSSPSSPELWKCGNLARSWRDFQAARGKRGRPAFGFPRFPQTRHFHSSLFCRDVFSVPPWLSGSFNCRWPGDLIVADLIAHLRVDEHSHGHS